MREVTDEEISEATVSELEALEFRLYVELRNREESTLSEMVFDGSRYDPEGPY